MLKRSGSSQTRRALTLVFPSLPYETQIVADEEITGTAVGSLFVHNKAPETLAVWVAFFAAFGMTASTFYWSPVSCTIMA